MGVFVICLCNFVFRMVALMILGLSHLKRL
jgi:hypothetical protein